MKGKILIIILIIIAVLAIGFGIWYWQNSKMFSGMFKGMVENPTKELPQANPFEAETNPYDDYQNPFKE